MSWFKCITTHIRTKHQPTQYEFYWNPDLSSIWNMVDYLVWLSRSINNKFRLQCKLYKIEDAIHAPVTLKVDVCPTSQFLFYCSFSKNKNKFPCIGFYPNSHWTYEDDQTVNSFLSIIFKTPNFFFTLTLVKGCYEGY